MCGTRDKTSKSGTVPETVGTYVVAFHLFTLSLKLLSQIAWASEAILDGS